MARFQRLQQSSPSVASMIERVQAGESVTLTRPAPARLDSRSAGAVPGLVIDEPPARDEPPAPKS
jgi:antitoxin (DNA-binding transcriptional repressor) of toxin-antitoxin stability system